MYVETAARVALGMVFTIAVAGKLRGDDGQHELARSLARLRVAPAGWERAAAIGLVGAEIVVVAALAAPWSSPIVFMPAIALCALLTGGVVLALRRTTGPTSCRCFGRSSAVLGPVHVVRNAGLLALAGAGAAAAADPDRAIGVIALGACCGVVLGIVVVLIDDLTAAVRSWR